MGLGEEIPPPFFGNASGYGLNIPSLQLRPCGGLTTTPHNPASGCPFLPQGQPRPPPGPPLDISVPVLDSPDPPLKCRGALLAFSLSCCFSCSTSVSPLSPISP